MFTSVRTLLFAHVTRTDLERLMNFYHKEGHCSLCCDVLFKYTFSAPKSGSFLFNYMLIRGYHVSSSMLGSALGSIGRYKMSQSLVGAPPNFSFTGSESGFQNIFRSSHTSIRCPNSAQRWSSFFHWSAQLDVIEISQTFSASPFRG